MRMKDDKVGNNNGNKKGERKEREIKNRNRLAKKVQSCLQ